MNNYREEFLSLNVRINHIYLERYLRFILTTQTKEVITEKHHILPKSLFPHLKKCKWNIKRLSLREHFIAHWILMKAMPDDIGMKYAFNSFISSGKVKNSYGYEKSRKNFICELSKKLSGNGNHFYGRKHTEATRNKISLSKMGVKNSTPEQRKLHSDRMSGPNNPFFNRKHKDDIKRLISEKMRGASSHDFGKPAWRKNSSKSKDDVIKLWGEADKFYIWFLSNRDKCGNSKGGSALAKSQEDEYRQTYQSIIKRFLIGWIPSEDMDWKDFYSK